MDNPYFNKTFKPPKAVSPLIRTSRWSLLVIGIVYGNLRYHWLLAHWPPNILRDNISYYVRRLDQEAREKKARGVIEDAKFIALLNGELNNM